MSKSKISSPFISKNVNNNSTPKKAKIQIVKNSKRIQENNNNNKSSLFEENLEEENLEEEKKSKSGYQTPYISKNKDISYSKMEIPVSYQLSNGRCIHLRNSQMIMNNDIQNEINNIELTVGSKSSNTNNLDNSFLINNNGKESPESKINNSLINYGKNKSIYPMKFLKHHQKKIKEESQSYQNQRNENGMKTYKKFNLMINPSYKYNKKFISSPIHKFLPYCKKNDEKYKKNLISYIRNENLNFDSGVKSVSCAFANYHKNNNNENPKEDDNQFFCMKKKKKIYSTKKIFCVEKDLYNYELIDGKNKVDYRHPKKFRFYFDIDIGFNHSWQSPLIVANGDDDVETDDEVMDMATEKCMEDLVEGINTWKKSSRLCRNYVLAKRFNRFVNTPTFNRVMNNKGNRKNTAENRNKNEKSNNYCDNIFNENIVSFGK